MAGPGLIVAEELADKLVEPGPASEERLGKSVGAEGLAGKQVGPGLVSEERLGRPVEGMAFDAEPGAFFELQPSLPPLFGPA